MSQVTIIHGKNRLQFDGDIKLGDLKVKIEEATGVDAESQKLIARGKQLNDDELVIAGGTNVMLLGSSKKSVARDSAIREIRRLEKEISGIDRDRQQHRDALEEVKRGFLNEAHTHTALTALAKKVAGCQERLMQCLEGLDGVSSLDDVIRAQRKAAVEDCNSKLRSCDLLNEMIKEATTDAHGELVHRRGD